MNLLDQECSICGCKGLHACIGYRVLWSEEAKERLDLFLKEFCEK